MDARVQGRGWGRGGAGRRGVGARPQRGSGGFCGDRVSLKCHVRSAPAPSVLEIEVTET